MMGTEELKCSGKILLEVGYDKLKYNSFYTRNVNEVNGPNILRQVYGKTYCVDKLGECSASVPILRYQYNGNGKSPDDLYIVGSQRNIPYYKFKETLCYAWPSACYLDEMRSIRHGKLLAIAEQKTKVDIGETVNFACNGQRYPKIGTEWWLTSKAIKCFQTAMNIVIWDIVTKGLQCLGACKKPALENVQISGYKVNSIGKVNPSTTATVSCNYGFTLNTGEQSNTIKCYENDSQWKPQLECLAIPTCENPDILNGWSINYSKKNPSGKAFAGTIANIKCQDGFQITSGIYTGTTTCQENQQWHPQIICYKIPSCNEPVIQNGQIGSHKLYNKVNTFGKAKIGTIVSIRCNDGYRISIDIYSTTMKCRENGQWDPPQVNCQAIPRCKAVVVNGKLTSQAQSMLAGETVNFACNYGFKLNTNANMGTIKCGEDGLLHTTDLCQAVLCNLQDLTAIQYGKLPAGKLTASVDEEISFQCASGRYPNDVYGWYYNKPIKCTESGNWESANLTCGAACESPLLINGRVAPYTKNLIGKVNAGTKLMAACNHGFKLSNKADTALLVCQDVDSQWKPIITCKPVCYLQDLQSIPYSSISTKETNVDVGESVDFKCIGPRYPNIAEEWWFVKPIKCLSSDKWENNIKCRACDKPVLKDRQLGAVSINKIGKVGAGTTVTSNCNYGYEPSNWVEQQTLTCDERNSLWIPNVTCLPRCKLVCQNNGECIENRLGGSDRCDCPLGFTGKLCESEITGGTFTDELVEINDQLGVISTLSDMEPYLTAQMNYTVRHGMSVPAEEFIAYCSFAGQSCPPIKHNDFVHMGSCYTINHDPNNATIVKRAGLKQGLRLILFNNETEFMGHSVRIGVKVIIHKQGEPVFPENQGRYLSSGFQFLIPIKYVETKRVERKCASEEFLESVDYFYDAEYTTEGCLKTCYQKKVISACGCGDPSVGIPKDKDISYCSVNERNCVNSIENIKPGECVCPEPCNISTYEQTYSFAKWPAKKYRVPLCEKIVQESIWKDEDLKRCNEAYRKTHLKIDIFYNQLSYLVWTEYPTYTLSNLWSDFGNLFDLFFGVGYIWFFEVAVIVWQVFFITIGIKIVMCCQRLFANNVNPGEI